MMVHHSVPPLTAVPAGGGVSRSCSWSVTPATPPAAVTAHRHNHSTSTASTTLRHQQQDDTTAQVPERSRLAEYYYNKRASITQFTSGGRSPPRPAPVYNDPPSGGTRHDRSPRRSLGAVWRVSSSSPARQLGAWFTRRPRSFNDETTCGSSSAGNNTLTPPSPIGGVPMLIPSPWAPTQVLAVPSSPNLSHCSSSPELPSPLDCGLTATLPSATSCLSSSPSVASLAASGWLTHAQQVPLGKSHQRPRRPTRLIISGRARHRRPLHHTPCVTRLCNVTVTRLQVTAPIGGDLNSVTLAVKMQSSKRTLRSNEIPLPPQGSLDIELQLTFSLQYPHFLKREGNTLHVMLQRRKKYKNRTIMGFKTLAVGVINMSEVLQRPVDRELELYIDGKEKGISSIARVTMVALSSQPVDTDEVTDRHKPFLTDNPDRSVDLVEVYSDDDEDYSSQDEGSDSEPILEAGGRRHPRLRQNTRSKSLPPNARQRNLKQRFIALLKRFKVPEALQAFDQDQDLDPRTRGEVDEAEIEDLFDELEDLSDSGPEVDTISITSTPKPSLRPYFSSSRSLLNEGLTTTGVLSTPRIIISMSPNEAEHYKIGADRLSDESSKRADSDHCENWTDQETSDPQCLASSPPREDKNKSNKNKLFARDKSNMSLKERRSISSIGGSTPRQEKQPVERSNSTANADSSPRKVLLEQLARLLPLEEVSLPDHLVMVNTAESHGPLLSAHLADHGHKVITTMGCTDVKATVQHLVNKLQKFCNSNAKTPEPWKIVLVGSDTYISQVLRPYVEHFSSKPPDFQHHIRFLIIPLGVNSLAKYLGSIDSTYGAAFVSDSWREVVERWEKTDVQEVVNRIHRYVTQAQQTLQLPIAEAMLTYKEKRC
ncbi:unnamed protein product, partial [Meganyctiphanes norvegica]